MPRYFLVIEYEGTEFSGWQRQDGAPSVQQSLEDALARLGEENCLVYGAGRTDAGVHAEFMVAHVDLARNWSAQKLPLAINAQTGRHDLAVLRALQVHDEAHARFDAVERAYRYRFLDRNIRSPLRTHHVWHRNRPLDVEAMHEAAQFLAGKHDFTTFRSAQCQSASPLKSIDHIKVTRRGDEVHLDVRARSFLHNQIRSFAGSLDMVGLGRWPATRINDALAACDRSACGPVAPADGLYLTDVVYTKQLNVMLRGQSVGDQIMP